MKSSVLLIALCFCHELTAFHFGASAYQLQLESSKHHKEKNEVVGGIFEAYSSFPHTYYYGMRTLIGMGNLNGKNHFGDKIDSFILEKTIEGRLGYHFFCNLSIVPYTGVGFYSLDHEWKKAEVVTRYRYLFVPLGIELNLPLNRCLTLGIQGQVDLMFWGKWQMDGHPALSDVKENLIKRPFFQCELPLHYNLSKINLTVSFIPFFRYGTIEKGKSQNISFDAISLRAWGARLEIGILNK